MTFLNPQAAQSLNYYHIGYLLLQEVERGLPSQRTFYFPQEHGFMIYPEVRAYVFPLDSTRLMILYDVYSEYYERSLFSQYSTYRILPIISSPTLGGYAVRLRA